METRTRDTLLETRNLHVAYGKVEAVRDVSLEVRRGTIVSVIGPNGAGKTTLLSALMAIVSTASGRGSSTSAFAMWHNVCAVTRTSATLHNARAT